jgi:hypothetical protein
MKQVTLTPLLLKLEWINKWDGRLPNTQVGGSSDIMLNIK